MNSEFPTVQIITIGTSLYLEQTKDLLFSISNFWPNSNKIVSLLCDDLDEGTNILQNLDYENAHIIKSKCIKITDLIYPCINLNKMCFINDYIDKEADYVFYFDADTEFMKRDDDFWSRLKNSLDDNRILIPISINCVSSFFPDLYYPEERNNRIFDTQIKNMYQENNSSPAFETYNINDSLHLWAMTSCIVAKANIMRDFCKYYIKFASETIKQQLPDNSTYNLAYTYVVPKLSDETIINKIIHNSESGVDTTFKFSIHPYAKQYKHTIPDEDYMFIYQKHKGKAFKKYTINK